MAASVSPLPEQQGRLTSAESVALTLLFPVPLAHSNAETFFPDLPLAIGVGGRRGGCVGGCPALPNRVAYRAEEAAGEKLSELSMGK